MHHTLKFYNANRTFILRFYMFGARCTRIPLIGGLARKISNVYARSEHRAYLLTPAEAKELIAISPAIASSKCTCRTMYHKCDNPRDNEILLAPSKHVLLETMPEGGQEITQEKAKEILADSQRRGLVMTIIKCRGDYYAICSCCSCCCIPLRFSKQYGIGEALQRHKDIVKEFRDYVSSYKDHGDDHGDGHSHDTTHA
jgi:hypothetical protein